MTRRGLTLALAISLSAATGSGLAHADTCQTMATGSYTIDGVYGQIPNVRMGGSRTIDNTLHLNAPDQGSAGFEMTVIPTSQQGGYTPGPAPSVRLSVDGGPSHSFSFSWRPGLAGNLSTWNSDRVEFGGLSRGDHVLHETLSMPAGTPDGTYELGAEAYLGPCAMISPTKLGPVSYWFTGGDPAHTPTPAPGGGTTRKPSPPATASPSSTRRATATATPRPSSQATATSAPEPDPLTDSPSPSPSPSPAVSDSPSPSPSPTPSSSPTPSPVDSPTAAGSPTAVPLAASPAAHGSSALPWLLGTLLVAAIAVGGVLALRRRRAAGGPADMTGDAAEATAAGPEPTEPTEPAPDTDTD
ncbi:hypothetical protein GCM10009665_67470 [Kitasatospora nipponensis]|uniref:LPXTG-motif cell wall-anchored protein n=1 Tax=Kitasatospora nipponensis TaxID=258049 RepID=A0ABP4HLV2_9ACTN